ncbi:LUD domain-containing protein [Flavobacterium sp. UMI-01]|uniref:LutC/YkgG family protein n=1 Tax=Flavobacterium sp. UMI-01 TaxID=1441053 RepID=UPI001C7CB3D2|nr:LUD domain-containing protein [Flavobacterium sp. UMI-01]GIZ08624.1 hypothetical protein FUMI01_13510 [Flavobacterium sp. UMI-01]
MNSREKILAKIAANKPELIELPNINISLFEEEINLIQEFTKKVEVVGGQVYHATSNQDVVNQILAMIPNTPNNYSTLEGIENFNTIDLQNINRPQDLEDLDILILESDLAVAENGAVWIEDDKLPIRVLPFITNHLVLVISKNNLVPFMHHAYQKITKKPTGFGVFIAGPSKTADIEQSLVIGAHGALSLSVFIK